MRKISKKLSVLLVFTMFVVGTLSIALTTASSANSVNIKRNMITATQTTDTLTGSVAGREIDYFPITASPGLMSVSVTWGNSYDIDCYIMTSANYLSYLARGYTTSKPETCSYTIQSASTNYVGIRMYTSYASSTSYTVTVTYYEESGVDTEAPSVTITSPTSGATVSDTITIAASASDNEGVDYLRYNVDGGSWNTDSFSPYSWSLDTTGLSGGTHTIYVEAYDAAGNVGTDSLSFTVSNPTGNDPVLISQDLTGSVAGSEIDYFAFMNVNDKELEKYVLVTRIWT